LVQLDHVAGRICHECLVPKARNVLGFLDSHAALANRRDRLREVINLDREMRRDDLIALEQVHLAVAELQPRSRGHRAIGSLYGEETKHIAVKGVCCRRVINRDSYVLNPRRAHDLTVAFRIAWFDDIDGMGALAWVMRTRHILPDMERVSRHVEDRALAARARLSAPRVADISAAPKAHVRIIYAL
jgi:hypothetical protein